MGFMDFYPRGGMFGAAKRAVTGPSKFEQQIQATAEGLQQPNPYEQDTPVPSQQAPSWAGPFNDPQKRVEQNQSPESLHTQNAYVQDYQRNGTQNWNPQDQAPAVSFADVRSQYGPHKKQSLIHDIGGEDVINTLNDQSPDHAARHAGWSQARSKYNPLLRQYRYDLGYSRADGANAVRDTQSLYNQAQGQYQKNISGLKGDIRDIAGTMRQNTRAISRLPGGKGAGAAAVAQEAALGAGNIGGVGKLQAGLMRQLAGNLAATGAFQTTNMRNKYANEQNKLQRDIRGVISDRANAATAASQDYWSKAQENKMRAYQLQESINDKRRKQNEEPTKYEKDKKAYLDAQSNAWAAVGQEKLPPEAAYRMALERTPKKFQPMLRQWWNENKADLNAYYKQVTTVPKG